MKKLVFPLVLILVIVSSCSQEIVKSPDEVIVYPNPFDNHFYIRVGPAAYVEAYLIGGEVEAAQSFNIDSEENPIISGEYQAGANFEVRMLDQPPGLYYLDIIMDGKGQRIKLWKRY